MCSGAGNIEKPEGYYKDRLGNCFHRPVPCTEYETSLLAAG